MVCSFLLAMAAAPNIQSRAREELDSVVGPHRLPAMEDIPSLTYTQAVTLEVMRLYPVLPFSVPHASIEDDEYGGYFIPGGSTIIGVRISRQFSKHEVSLCHRRTHGGKPRSTVSRSLIFHPRAIMRDPAAYPDEPESFNPDRFIKNGQLDPDVPNPQALYGFGRRYPNIIAPLSARR